MTITLTREEAQQVLDAFESATPKYTRARKDGKTLGGALDYWKLEQHKRMPALKILRARLSAPEPEPVACPKEPANIEELYTAPPQREWQGLTDEEILEEYRQSYGDDGNLTDVYFARAIEAKLKEKNG
jgi:hypothetical protein